MITKNVKLYLGDGFPVRIPVSQYDTMWQFVFTIVNNSQPWQIPTGATAVLNGKKPDGNVFAFAGTIENNAVKVDADVQMTAVAGQTVCELSILADGKTVGTANFILDVEEAPKSADDVVSDTVLDGYGMMVTNAVDDYIARHPEVFGGDKFTQSAKNALLALLEKVAYIDENGQTYIDALESELFPPANLVSISAVFNQGENTIYDTDSLDVLKQYLTVTANYNDSTTETVTDYVLSGTLSEGTSMITASYGGKVDTFTAEVTRGFLYTPAKGLLSEQSYVANGINTDYFSESIYDGFLRLYSAKTSSSSTEAGTYHFTDDIKWTTKLTATLVFKVVDMIGIKSSNTTTPGCFALAFANNITNGETGFAMGSTGFARYNSGTADVRMRNNTEGGSAWLTNVVSLNDLHTLQINVENGLQTVTLDGTAIVTNGNLYTSTTYFSGSAIRLMRSNQAVTDIQIKSLEVAVE